MPINYLQPLSPSYFPLQEGRGGDLFGEMLRNQQERNKTRISDVNAKYAEPMAQNAMKLSNYLMGMKEKYGEREAQADLAEKLASAQLKQEMAKTGGSRSGMTQGFRAWSSLPSQEKQGILAQTRGWGYGDDETVMALSQGKTLADLKESAMNNGVDVDNSELIYRPTTSNITQMKNQEGAVAEIDVLEKYITDGMKKYGQTLFGVSPEQVIDAISGDKEDEQAHFLASRALQPELAGVRTRLAGGSNAQEALKDMTEKSLGEIKIFRPLVTPAVYEKTQHELNSILKKGVQARSKAVKGVMKEKDLYGESNKKLENTRKENYSGNPFDPFGLR